MLLIKVIFFRSYEFLMSVGRCVVKSYCSDCPYFGGGFLGEGVNDSICVKIPDMAPKKIAAIWSRLEHKECVSWSTGNVLLGTQGMSCLEHKECLAWNTRSVLLGTQGLSCLERRPCAAWHTNTWCQKLSGAQFHAQEQNRHGHIEKFEFELDFT